MSNQVYTGVTARPYQLLCVVCSIGQGVDRPENDKVSRLLEAVKAERRANADAERKYPLPDPLKPDYSQAAAQKQALAQADLSTALLEKYKGEVAETHGLTSDQLDEIIMEGFTKDWPSPPRE